MMTCLQLVACAYRLAWKVRREAAAPSGQESADGLQLDNLEQPRRPTTTLSEPAPLGVASAARKTCRH